MQINRKMLADMAVNDMPGFERLARWPKRTSASVFQIFMAIPSLQG